MHLSLVIGKDEFSWNWTWSSLKFWNGRLDEFSENQCESQTLSHAPEIRFISYKLYVGYPVMKFKFVILNLIDRQPLQSSVSFRTTPLAVCHPGRPSVPSSKSVYIAILLQIRTIWLWAASERGSLFNCPAGSPNNISMTRVPLWKKIEFDLWNWNKLNIIIFIIMKLRRIKNI